MAVLAVLAAALWSTPAAAQSCAPATTQGTAPAGWQTYCWLDFASYSDATARSAGGQNFSFGLSDGSTLTFNLRVTPGTGTAFNSVTAPSWTGAAVGNTAFLGIPGRPILYTAAPGTRLITISGITITPPAGVSAVSAYSFVVADAESSNGGESLVYTTNGGGWTILDEVPPISGNLYPTVSGEGATTFTVTGVSGTVGGHIVGSNSPTTVTAQVTAGGLQGIMFAVRFASIRLNKVIGGARINAADQFNFGVTATSSGAALASGSTSGASNGPFAATALSLASGIGLTLSEAMAPGSVSSIGQYRSRLSCTNSGGSSTPLPTNVQTTSYSLGALAFGDALICTFTNEAFPHVRVRKLLGSGGRRFAGDQFTVRINNGAAVVASSTTSGTAGTITGGDTGLVQLVAGTNYTIDEIAAGTGNLGNYTRTVACANAATSSTVLPTTVGGAITPTYGDVVTCSITNTRIATANLTVSKVSSVVSDPVNGTTNPKLIPGAVVEYAITVTNVGNQTVSANTIIVADVLPANFTYDGATPVTFVNGATASGLNAFNAATMVSFSSQPSGGAPYAYTPTAGYDANVRGVRIAPTGTMAAATATTQPSFTIRFRGRVN
ncbi:MAG: hypothetical protein HC788_04160 [Sphingopyxis sp.]|nr:hypothetical protein [Sphingopyxis sp.]